MRTLLVATLAVATLLQPAWRRAGGQTRPTFRLEALHDSAARANPRGRQAELLARQSRLRLKTLATEQQLPAVSLDAYGQYQSDVVRFPSAAPGATTPPHDVYDARLSVTQRVFDPTARGRRAVERAQLEQSQAALRATLFATWQQVNDAFFSALRAQAAGNELRAAISALEAQLVLAAARVREGSALPSEENAVRAELLLRRQALSESQNLGAASVAVLSELTGVALDSAALLEAPDLGDAVARAGAGAERPGLRARPEFDQFARARDVLARQERVRGAQDLPRLSAFARAGYGRPGLNPLNVAFDTYWLAGVQLQWTPWSWGANRRDREVLAVQRQIIATEEEAFAEQLGRLVTQELAAIERLESALAMDEEIIALRERIAEETRIRFGEAAVTAAEYVDRQTQLLGARLTRATHRVELAQARARLLITLGLEVR